MSTTSSQSSSETPQVESSYQNTSSKPENPSVPAEELITRSSIMSNASNTSIVSAKYILIDNIEITLMKQYPTNLGNMIRNILSDLNLFPTFISNPTIEQTIMDQPTVIVVTKHDESTTFINQWYTKVNHDFAYNTTSISTTHIINHY